MRFSGLLSMMKGTVMFLLLEESCGFQVLIVDEGIETGALLQPFVGRDVPVAVGVG